jgi:Transglutaminase-like superfamily
VRLMRKSARSPKRRAAREARIVSFSHRLCRGRLREGSCLERSLLAYRFLSEEGADPTLVVAVRTSGDSFEWHAWVTRDGRPVHESEEALRAYLPVVIFDARGAVKWRSSTAGFLAGARL